jgi:membrane dipeptidase
VKGLVDSPRNLTDEELELIKKNGGVVQVVAFGNYVRPVPKEITDQVAALQAEYGYKGNEPPPGLPEAKRMEYADRNRKILSAVPPATVAQFVDSIDYAVKKIGIDHVGISSDFNHGGGVVGWENEGECQNVTAELLRRHYSERDIAKLWGGNFLRVWAEAQNVGKALQAHHQTRAQ